nr:MAG TPA: hypothetical protein [Caudoviricetes sp.]
MGIVVKDVILKTFTVAPKHAKDGRTVSMLSRLLIGVRLQSIRRFW